MKPIRVVLSGAALLILATGNDGARTVMLHQAMTDVVAPQAEALWDVGNRAMDDSGNPDVSKLTSADWAKLTSAADAMKAAATGLAGAGQVLVGPPGTKIQDEGTPGGFTAQQVQANIDSDPKGFAEHAQKLAAVSDEFVRASQSRDAKTLIAGSGRLDEVCEGCHVKFWYPAPAAAAAQ